MESALTVSVIIRGLVLELDGLVLGYKGLHDAPANEVGNGTDAEDDHVGCGLALETEEREGTALSSGPVEEAARDRKSVV